MLRWGLALALVVMIQPWSAKAPMPRPCDGFDFPVGPPDATGYYDAQPFGRNRHLGADWNGNGGLDTDRGDPVHAVSAGIVIEALDHGGGWGDVVRIVHSCAGVESLYAHLDTVDVEVGTVVLRGRPIGTIGDAHGQYRAHLHFEMRDQIGMPLGGGYAELTRGYVDPTRFIRAHR